MKRILFEERTIKRFAWLPMLLDDGNTIWLKSYKVNQHFGQKERGITPTRGSKTGSPRLSENYWVTTYTYL